MEYTVYADGACSGNPGPGGYAFIIMNENKDVLLKVSGSKSKATNNQMEMTAVLESLKALEDMGLSQKKLLLSLDSDYVRKALSDSADGTAWIKGWKKRGWRNSNGKAVANQDLWKEIDKEIAKFSDLTLQHVDGHADSDGNNLADALVNEQMDEM